MKTMLRTEEAARHLGLSASTLAKMRVYGTGPTFFKLGRTVAYRVEDLEAWLQSQRRQSTSELSTEGGA